MQKIGAWAILITIITGLSASAGSMLMDHAERITRVEEKEKTDRQLLQEVRDDIKTILRKIR